jgi:hypothetical protein
VTDETRPAKIAELLYKETPFERYGNMRLYLEVLQMPIEWTKTFVNEIGWKVYWEKRKYKNALSGYVIVRKRPLEWGNVWEETLLFEGEKILPEEAYV